MAEKKLFLLDAFALIYRAHFAFIHNPRVSSTGQNTSAVFGFVNSLLEILNKENPSHLGVAFDTAAPTFRHKEYPAYKADRDETPEDIIWAVPMIKRLLKGLNIPVLELDGFEADDIIGTLAKRAESDGFNVYMVTPDKDFAQLVTEKVFLYKPARMGNGIDVMDPARVEEKMGIPPEKVIDFLGLKGDKVDNIPGIPKVGDKTAVALIKTFGTVEEIVKRAEEITKNSIRLSVIENGEQGLLSKKLATIDTEVPVEWEEKDLEVGGPDKEATIQLLNELEFRATAKRILQSPIFGGAPSAQTDLFGNSVAGGVTVEPQLEIVTNYENLETKKHKYFQLNTATEIEKFAKQIEKTKVFCFDTETTGLDPMEAEIIAITMSVKPGEACMIHIEEGDDKVREKLGPITALLESEKILKIGQNLKYDMLLLRNYDIEVAGPLFDTMVANYVLNPDKPHNMDAMARELLNYEAVSITSLIGKKGKNQLSMRDVEVEKLLEYACEDADVTLALKEKLAPKVSEGDFKQVFEEVDMPLVQVLTQMEFYGIKVDDKALKKYSIELKKELAEIEKEIYKLSGMEFNINSPKQLGEIIFDRLKLGKGKKTKTGQYSTREEILTELASTHEMPEMVLRFRQLGKLKSTYVDAIPALINSKTGRVHTTYGQTIASTGRLSSNHPNLQNIPIRTPEGREIRKAFIPEGKDMLLLSADYSQVELRLMASLSGDKGMIEAFQKGHDIHKATAAKVFGVELEDVDSDMRAKAKMVNFGIIYGISAFGLGQRLGISRFEAQEIIEAYFSKYPGIKAYMDESIKFARKNGYARTIMGRRRYLPDINSQNKTIQAFAERTAINTPVQGSAADLIKLAMIKIHDEILKRKLKTRMLLQVHDELVFEVHKKELEEVQELVRDGMENALKFDVPMIVEMGTGTNWLEAH